MITLQYDSPVKVARYWAGEGFEQQTVRIDGGEIYVSPWSYTGFRFTELQ